MAAVKRRQSKIKNEEPKNQRKYTFEDNFVWNEFFCFYLGAKLSNSSKKRRQGFAAWALSKVLRTEASLSPMYFDNSSGP